jgi:diguanylate cyclase (GGDEF)-like protein
VIEQLRLAAPGLDKVRITVSAGIAVAPPGGAVTAEQLFTLADERLYRAKAQGRNRIEGAATARVAAVRAPAVQQPG